MDFPDEFDIIAENAPTKLYFCGDCNREMPEDSKQPSSCRYCGNSGWNISFRCPECGRVVRDFRQNPKNSIPCYT